MIVIRSWLRFLLRISTNGELSADFVSSSILCDLVLSCDTYKSIALCNLFAPGPWVRGDLHLKFVPVPWCIKLKFTFLCTWGWSFRFAQFRTTELVLLIVYWIIKCSIYNQRIRNNLNFRLLLCLHVQFWRNFWLFSSHVNKKSWDEHFLPQFSSCWIWNFAGGLKMAVA